MEKSIYYNGKLKRNLKKAEIRQSPTPRQKFQNIWTKKIQKYSLFLYKVMRENTMLEDTGDVKKKNVSKDCNNYSTLLLCTLRKISGISVRGRSL